MKRYATKLHCILKLSYHVAGWCHILAQLINITWYKYETSFIYKICNSFYQTIAQLENAAMLGYITHNVGVHVIFAPEISLPL